MPKRQYFFASALKPLKPCVEEPAARECFDIGRWQVAHGCAAPRHSLGGKLHIVRLTRACWSDMCIRADVQDNGEAKMSREASKGAFLSVM